MTGDGESDQFARFDAILEAARSGIVEQAEQGAAWQPKIADPDTGDAITSKTFWAGTPWLAACRQAAEATDAAPPWAVLAGLLTLLSASMNPQMRIRLGDAHPPTNYLLLVGPPGAGKTAGTNAARQLLDRHAQHVTEISPGSGEGVLAAIMGKQQKPEDEEELASLADPLPGRPNILVSYDEAAIMTQIKNRSGTTLSPILRAAWAGGRLSTDNSDPARQRRIPAGSYNLACLIAAQPPIAAETLADTGLGDKERWIALPATWDRNLPLTDLPPLPAPIDAPLLAETRLAPPTEILIDPAIRHQALIDRRLLAGRPSTDPDTDDEKRREQLERIDHGKHTVSLRLRIAAQIAVLTTRTTLAITKTDWRLAGIILGISKQTQDWIMQTAKHVRHQEAHQKRQTQAANQTHTAAALHQQKTRTTNTIVEAIAQSIANHTTKHGIITRKQMRSLIGSRGTQLALLEIPRKIAINDARRHAEDQQWIIRTGDNRWEPGPNRP